MLTAGLGLVPDGLAGVLRIRNPVLPGNVDRVAMRNLRIAGGRVDLLFERVGDDAVAITNVDIEGDVDVILEFGSRGARDHAPDLRGPA